MSLQSSNAIDFADDAHSECAKIHDGKQTMV